MARSSQPPTPPESALPHTATCGSLSLAVYTARLGSPSRFYVALSSQPLTPPDSARPPTVTWLALLNSLLRPTRLIPPLLRGSVFSTAYAARIGSSPYCYVWLASLNRLRRSTRLSLLNRLRRPTRPFHSLLRGSLSSTAYAAQLGSPPIHCYVARSPQPPTPPNLARPHLSLVHLPSGHFSQSVVLASPYFSHRSFYELKCISNPCLSQPHAF